MTKETKSSDVGAAARAVPDVALGRRKNDNNCERIAVQAREKEVKCDDNVDWWCAVIKARTGYYLRMRVAPLRLMRHMEEHAMSYMRKR